MKYTTYLDIYENLIDSIHSGDLVKFRYCLRRLTKSLSFRGYLSTKEAKYFVDCCFFAEDQRLQYTVLRNLYYFLTKKIETNTAKAVEKTREFLNLFLFNGFYENRVVEQAFSTVEDNVLLITEIPKQYYLITEKYDCFLYEGTVCEVYNEQLCLEKKIQVYSSDERGKAYLQGDQVFFYNFTNRAVSTINPLTLELKIVEKKKGPVGIDIYSETDAYLFYTKSEEREFYRFDKRIDKEKLYATICENYLPSFNENLLVIYPYLDPCLMHTSKLASIRPYFYTLNGNLIESPADELNAYLIRLLMKVAADEAFWPMNYLREEELVLLKRNGSCISIEYLIQFCKRLEEGRFTNTEILSGLKYLLETLKQLDFDESEDIKEVLLSLLDYVRYCMIDGRHPGMLFTRKFCRCWNEVLKDTRYSKEEIRRMLREDPNRLFEDFIIWKEMQMNVIQFHIN